MTTMRGGEQAHQKTSAQKSTAAAMPNAFASGLAVTYRSRSCGTHARARVNAQHSGTT